MSPALPLSSKSYGTLLDRPRDFPRATPALMCCFAVRCTDDCRAGLRKLWTMARSQPSHLPSRLFHRTHEGFDFSRILDALGLFDAAADIHRVRLHLGNGPTDVIGRQPAGEDDWLAQARRHQ